MPSIGRIAALAVVLVGCAHRAEHHAKSDAEADITGARLVELSDGQVIVRGVVSYAGGHRVDWVGVEVPANQHGRLELELTCVTARRGIRLAFDLFDQQNDPLAADSSGSGPVRTATLDDVRGAVFVRIRAQHAGDAGSYKLIARFAPVAEVPRAVASAPPPPPPPAVPVCRPFDPENPACATVCPAYGSPPYWPGCANVCLPSDPDDKLACLKTRPCPPKPDTRYLRCTPDHWRPCPDPTDPDLENPNCPRMPTYAPVIGRIQQVTVAGRDIHITINVGANSHVDGTWQGHVLRDNGTPQPGGSARVLQVSKRGEVKLAVRLTLDELAAPNDRVQLSPP